MFCCSRRTVHVKRIFSRFGETPKPKESSSPIGLNIVLCQMGTNQIPLLDKTARAFSEVKLMLANIVQIHLIYFYYLRVVEVASCGT